MSRAAFVAWALLLAASGCERKPPAPPAGTRAEASGSSAAPAARGPRQPGVVSRLAPIRVADTEGLLVAPAGARVLAPVAHAAIGERVEGRWCLGAGSLAEHGAALARAYEAGGWQDVAWRPHPRQADRGTLSARRPPFALYGSVAPSAACAHELALGVHRVEAVAPATGDVGAKGTTGLRVR